MRNIELAGTTHTMLHFIFQELNKIKITKETV